MGKFIEEYYNEIEISYTAAKAHPKSAFQMRNREMVDRADLVICYSVIDKKRDKDTPSL